MTWCILAEAGPRRPPARFREQIFWGTVVLGGEGRHVEIGITIETPLELSAEEEAELRGLVIPLSDLEACEPVAGERMAPEDVPDEQVRAETAAMAMTRGSRKVASTEQLSFAPAGPSKPPP